MQILCRHLHFLNRELFERAVNILIPLAEVGCLDEIPIPSESLFCLWSDPRTSLLACKQMFFHSISKPDIQDQLLSCTLHQIMEQVLLDRGQTDAGGTELTQLLLFFVRHSGAGRIGEAGNKALAQLLTDLKRHSQKQELYLRQIVYKLGQRMEQAKDTLDWGACFRLVCLLMREIYYGRGSLPTVRAVPSCKALRQILFNQYVRLLQSDAKFLNGVSGLLDLALFSNAFWNDIYQESRAAWKEQHMLQRPSKALQAQTSSERANSRYLCQIHLTLLTTLMQNQPDPALERYFADFLSDVFLPKYELLTCNTIIASIATFKKANNKQKRQTNAGNPTAKQNRVPYEPRQGAGPDFGLSTREGGPSSWTTSSQWDSDRDCRAEGIVPSFPFPPGPPGRPLHGESAYCPSQQCLRA